MTTTKRLFLGSMLAGAIAPAIDAATIEPRRAAALPVEGPFPSLAGATAWLGSPPLTPARLRGKVVLIGFWTYSCINWLRSLPSVRAWDAAYRKHGLVVIGVHTPEFDFEKDLDNVRRAVTTMRVDYPVAVDSNGVIWRAFSNAYWPALYFIDAKGRIRHCHFGEGDEERSEQVIRQLLAQAGAGDLRHESAAVDARGVEAAADWADLKSDENYLGHERTLRFAPSNGIVPEQRHVYAAPARLTLNTWSLAGDWMVTQSFAVLNESGGRIVYRFHSRDLHIVMGPARPGSPVRFKVLVNGHPPAKDHGIDIDEQGLGTVSEPRLHQLIRQKKPIVDRDFEIEFLDPGVQVYAFTFG